MSFAFAFVTCYLAVPIAALLVRTGEFRKLADTKQLPPRLLLRRRRLWLPRWLLERSVSQAKFAKAMKFMRKPSHHIDKLLKPRLTYLTQGPGLYTIALICSAVALMMPPMEFIPFSANFAGAALTLFGLALIARDGLLALLGFGLTGLAVGFIGYQTLL